MMYTSNYQSNIQKGQGMSMHAPRVLALRTNYEALITVFTLAEKS